MDNNIKKAFIASTLGKSGNKIVTLTSLFSVIFLYCKYLLEVTSCMFIIAFFVIKVSFSY